MSVLDESRLELMRRRLAGVDAGGSATGTPPTPDAAHDPSPRLHGELGVAERRMWRIHQLDPESVSHNIGLVLTFTDGRSTDEVVTALQETLRSPVLSSVLVNDEGVVRRESADVEGGWSVPDTVWEWPAHAEGAAAPGDVDETSLTRRPFRLAEEVPARARLTVAPDGTCTVILVVHHIAVDGTSWPALLGPLVTGTSAVTPVAGVAADRAAPQVDDALRHALSTWAADDIRHPLTGALPTESAEQSWITPLDEGAVTRDRRALDPAVVAALGEVAREVGATSNALMIGVCALAAHSLTGADDLVMLVPSENRRSDEDPREVGYCGTIVPIRCTVDPTASVRESLRRMMSAIYSSMEFASIDYGTLLTALRARGGRFPVADVMASVRSAPVRGVTETGSGVDYRSVSTGVGGYPLSYAFEITDDGIHLEIDHRTDIPESEVTQRAPAVAMGLLAELPDNLDSTLADLVDAVRAACAFPELPTRRSRFASPGRGWAQVGADLIRMAESVSDTAHHGAPLPHGLPGDVLDEVDSALGPRVIPSAGVGESQALARLGDLVARHGLDLTHTRTAAHLQPPPLTVAVVADALAGATNASLDTYDSGPATLAIEQWMIAALADLAGLGAGAGGVFGPGGSYSNLLALLIARDHAASALGLDTRTDGTGALPRPVVFCSRIAHFSIHRACAALGLGESAVVGIDVDDDHRMLPAALESALAAAGDRTPVAVVATAGTTDFGTVDPLPEIAAIARRRGVWLHVDAAYGFGSLFSDRLAGLVEGIDRADSITLDLHKIGWQPAAASVLLLADSGRFAAVDRSVSYLNPTDDIEAGYGGLLGQTLQTTRRPDVLKVAATFLAYGRLGLGSMLDRCHELARHAEQRIATEPHLELIAPVTLTTVVFRYRCADLDAVNAELRRRLIRSGAALIGRTRVVTAGADRPQVCLKLTLLNPEAHEADIDALFDDIIRVALEVEAENTRALSTDADALEASHEH